MIAQKQKPLAAPVPEATDPLRPSDSLCPWSEGCVLARAQGLAGMAPAELSRPWGLRDVQEKAGLRVPDTLPMARGWGGGWWGLAGHMGPQH